jgi:hypothetical protein
MNLSKARDFYSAYYEGTLDGGLKQAFERALEQDDQISSEYGQFTRIMQELGTVAAPVEVPADLHLKIRERVDAGIAESQAKSRKANWFFAWKPIAYGAVATAAFIGVVSSISNRNEGTLATASLTPAVAETAPTLALVDGELRLQFSSMSPNMLTVTEAGSGRVLLNKSTLGVRIDSPIKNVSSDPVLLSIGFATGFDNFYAAIPGTSSVLNQTGSGTVLDLMKAVSGMYGVQVVTSAIDVSKAVDWDLESSDAMTSIQEELKLLGLQAETRESGLLWISPQ